jgi:hypothetical protein
MKVFPIYGDRIKDTGISLEDVLSNLEVKCSRETGDLGLVPSQDDKKTFHSDPSKCTHTSRSTLLQN